MTKYHINSKGIPGPCRAVKGNCPFGGADSHYDTVEQAQQVADEKNEQAFGEHFNKESSGISKLTTSMSNDEIFPEPEEHYGTMVVGVRGEEFSEMEDYPDDEMYAGARELSKVLPKEVTEDETVVVVPARDAKVFSKHMMIDSEGEMTENYEKLTNHLMEHKPEALDVFDEPNEEEVEKVSNYIAETQLKESKYELNGEKIIVHSFFEDNQADSRNWVKEYYSKNK